ncbi:hypothetical protein OY671_012167, partial [Metschnikowia pulcherrima]
MRCEGDRCAASSGKVGAATSCMVYAVRPEVCRICLPGDVECNMARRRHGLSPIVAPAGYHDVVVDLVVERLEGGERLGRQRDRLAAVVRGR